MQSREANSFGLLIAVLLEKGEPVTLNEAARRIADVTACDEKVVLDSLSHCRPARPPVYRTGDLYALDPHDGEAGLWAFRLGLQPPKPPPLRLVPEPLPGLEEPLTLAELDEAWRRYIPSGFSAQRLAMAVLDAHRRPMEPGEVVEYVEAKDERTLLSAESATYWRAGSPIHVGEDGLWELIPGHALIGPMRRAVRALIEAERRSNHPSREQIEANCKRWEQEREEHAKQLEAMRRGLVYGFPAERPEAVVLIDVNRRTLETLMGDSLKELGERLSGYDCLAGLEIRNLLQVLGVDPGIRPLGELGPPQKTRQINRRGRILKLTTELLVQGSCGISRPFGDKATMMAYLRKGKMTQFRRRVESDAKALLALYQYGRLHGRVRLRWGFLDEALPAPWVQRDEATLYELKKRSGELKVPLEIVTGSAPGWEHPWSRARLAFAGKHPDGWGYDLIDEDGFPVYEPEIQAARLIDDCGK
jgi:hypothetical protein